MYHAVIDTNVIVSALLTKHEDAATLQVMRAVFSGQIIPLYHKEIIGEYIEVLSRPRFHLKPDMIRQAVDSIVTNGIEVFPQPTGIILPDMDDLIFYEVAVEKRGDDAYLVTGNQKHYPVEKFVVTPAEMVAIMQKNA